MSQEILIDFENVTSEVYHKNTIWDIQDNEKIGLIEFIEEQIMHKVKSIIVNQPFPFESIPFSVVFTNKKSYVNHGKNVEIIPKNDKAIIIILCKCIFY